MCLEFVYINNDASDSEWQLVMANNRDEYYTRPTKPVDFWGENNECLSGIDLEAERNGGTWIGINPSNGKCACLLNILTNHTQKADKLGRGHLVSDFLVNSQTADEYLSPIESNKDKYYLFNLLLLEYRKKKWHVTYYTNKGDKNRETIVKEKFGVCNSVLDKPWQKLLYGQEIFNKVVEKNSKTLEFEKLKDELLELMNDPSNHRPDPQLESQGKGHLDDTLLTQRSAIFVESKHIKYGTRTNTLILIDGAGRGKYIERTMREPVDVNHPVWDVQTIDFVMNDKSHCPLNSPTDSKSLGNQTNIKT